MKKNTHNPQKIFDIFSLHHPQLMKKVTNNVWDVMPPVVAGILLVKWANADYHRRTQEHWS